jgi:hypothetical protein
MMDPYESVVCLMCEWIELTVVSNEQKDVKQTKVAAITTSCEGRELSDSA